MPGDDETGEWIEIEPWQPPYVEETPAYLRPRFVLGMVVLTALLALVMVRLGDSGTSTTNQLVALPGAERAGSDEDETTDDDVPTREDCPPPAGNVNREAADTVRAFLAALSGSRMSGLVIDPDVERQMGEPGEPAPLVRATRIGGFSTAGGKVSSCVRSWWLDGAGMHSSIDVVTVAPGAKGWRVSFWARGAELTGGQLTTSVPLAFLSSTRRCDDPDRFGSVAVPGDDAEQRVLAALEELMSGPAGRVGSAASQVPADVQVTAVEVEGLAATVELTGTSAKLSRCQSSAAFSQIVETVRAAVPAGAPVPPPDTTASRSRGGTAPSPSVLVVVKVDGQVVDTLKP